VRVGTLLTWADRILSFVQDGDFLSAIDLARSYYVGEAPGNRNGLPDDPQQRREVVGEKMHDLMVASTRYAFSEDRMTDGTHVTRDGQGVDRTSLFEGLVVTCARACVALQDYEFLFEDLFQQYEDAGISRIFLQQLETFVLDGDIPSVPPRITQRLVALHEDDGHPDLAERVIWHIDPACLDINQAILLCQTYHLYDALIYVYTRAMRDYVSPVVELLGLVRRVQQYRKSRVELQGNLDIQDDAALEPIVINAYKVYPYLADILAGLTYPSEEPLDADEGFQAKKDVYTFLFFGHSSVWPIGGGRLVLTSDEEGGVEPTYPYARLLLRFDAESFLHSLDIAFEDAYLNEESQGASRLVIVKILLDILSSGSLSPSDATFVRIFIARNVPKYPQFIQIAPSSLHNILIGLTDQPDPSTREDRQLAAEYLLSAYTPHDSDRILRLFEDAGFYRILRSWHRQEQRWAPLISAYLHDGDLHPNEIFASVDDVLRTATHVNNGALPANVLVTISDALPQLLEVSIANTASLVEKYMPEYHEKSLEALGQDAARQQFVYLHHLLGPLQPEDDEYITIQREAGPSAKVTQSQRHLYVSLQCQYHSSAVIGVLKDMPSELLDWQQVMEICEDKAVYHAVVWATNWRGDPREALSKAETFEKFLTMSIVQRLSGDDEVSLELTDGIDKEVSSLEEIGRIGIVICLERSQGPSEADVPLEDIWFQLLSSQINCVQSLSYICSEEAVSDVPSESEHVKLQRRTISALRSLVQETFGALVSITSTRAVSFPRLFKRLVDTATDAHRSMGTPYTEFRTILTGMLESYRSDGDMLIITKHLIDRDLFETVEEFARERGRGWTPVYRGTCSRCRRPLFQNQKAEPFAQPAAKGADSVPIIVSRTGAIYHHSCLPSES
jgi:vacuolar protein sorting-associated protein 8